MFIISFDEFTLLASVTWTGIGLVFYGLYSIRNSKEAHDRHGAPLAAHPVAATLGVGRDEDRIPNAPRKAAAPSHSGDAYHHKGGYTLYRRDIDVKGGGTRPLYFFAKKEPKSGKPAPKPAGYGVGVNDRTGLPYLRKE